MKEKKYEYLGMPLKMELLLRGFAPEIFDPAGKMSFKWTESLFSLNNGQIIWIKRKILEWINMINEKSGISVVSHKFKGVCHDRTIRRKSWEVTFQFEIPGNLCLLKMHPAVAGDFPGFFKKLLGEQLLRRFPFPFDPYSHSHPILFCAGITDMYVLKPHWINEAAIAKANSTLFSPAFGLWLEEILEKKHSAKLILVKSMGTPKKHTEFWFCSIILIRWQNDTDHAARCELKKDIEEKMAELGMKYMSSGFERPVFSVTFEY